MHARSRVVRAISASPNRMFVAAARELWFLGLLVGIAGCWSRGYKARITFAGETFCPSDRVAVQEIEVEEGPAGPAAAEVASDPERLAMWRDAHHTGTRYMATGCGQTRLYQCFGRFGCDQER